jgi:hypothetical protein
MSKHTDHRGHYFEFSQLNDTNNIHILEVSPSGCITDYFLYGYWNEFVNRAKMLSKAFYTTDEKIKENLAQWCLEVRDEWVEVQEEDFHNG